MTPARFHTRLSREVHEIESYLDPEEHVACRPRERGRRDSSGLRLSRRERGVRRGRGGRGAHLGRPAAGRPPSRRRQAGGEAARRSGRCPRPPVGLCPRRSASLYSSRPRRAEAGAGCGSSAPRTSSTRRSRPRGARPRRASATTTVFLERYLERPRHVEVQLLADTHGKVVRARRARLLDPATAPKGPRGERRRPRLDAVCAAPGGPQRSSSRGRPGMSEPGRPSSSSRERSFFFLELNARIQVEHPVTEAVTGIDLVEQQLRVASGAAARHSDPELAGHAVEVRLYAEDPRTFLPQAGRLDRARASRKTSGSMPESRRGTRCPWPLSSTARFARPRTRIG